MRLITSLIPLVFFISSPCLASGIRIYYKNFDDLDLAQKARQKLKAKGVPTSLILIKRVKAPCSPKSSISFMDFCIDKNKELQKIRQTSLAQKSLQPFLGLKNEGGKEK